MAVKIVYEKDGKVFESEGLNKTIRELGYAGPNKNSKDCVRWMESIGCTSIEVEGSEYQASEKKPSVKNMSPLEVIIKQYIKFNDANFEKDKKTKLENLQKDRELTIEKMVSALDIVALKSAKDELVVINSEIQAVKASTFEVTQKAVISWIKALYDDFEEAKAAAQAAQAAQEAAAQAAQAAQEAAAQEKEEK